MSLNLFCMANQGKAVSHDQHSLIEYAFCESLGQLMSMQICGCLGILGYDIIRIHAAPYSWQMHSECGRLQFS